MWFLCRFPYMNTHVGFHHAFTCKKSIITPGSDTGKVWNFSLCTSYLFIIVKYGVFNHGYTGIKIHVAYISWPKYKPCLLCVQISIWGPFYLVIFISMLRLRFILKIIDYSSTHGHVIPNIYDLFVQTWMIKSISHWFFNVIDTGLALSLAYDVEVDYLDIIIDTFFANKALDLKKKDKAMNTPTLSSSKNTPKKKKKKPTKLTTSKVSNKTKTKRLFKQLPRYIFDNIPNRYATFCRYFPSRTVLTHWAFGGFEFNVR